MQGITAVGVRFVRTTTRSVLIGYGRVGAAEDLAINVDFAVLRR